MFLYDILHHFPIVLFIFINFTLSFPFAVPRFFLSADPQFCPRMSLDFASERVCYVHCNFCNTILAVSVPCTIMFNAVTVRCGHCANLMSLNMGALLQTVHLQNLHKQSLLSQGLSESSSQCNKVSILDSSEKEPRTLPTGVAVEKKQRIPSAYNRFIKEEIQRIKANNPDISHREAFSTAAKNWAHIPHMNFGLTLHSNMEDKIEKTISRERT